LPNGALDRLDSEVCADGQRARRKLDEELRLGVNILVALAFESCSAHRGIELLLRRGSLQHKVEVSGLVRPAGVQGSTGTARQDAPDPRIGKDACNAGRNVAK
jgi:hypothetical protein